MKNVADIVTADATGEIGMGKDTGRRLCPTHDEIAQLAFCLYEASGGRTATMSNVGCVRNRTRAALRVIATCCRTITTH
jgi:hypothetical protein